MNIALDYDGTFTADPRLWFETWTKALETAANILEKENPFIADKIRAIPLPPINS